MIWKVDILEIRVFQRTSCCMHRIVHASNSQTCLSAYSPKVTSCGCFTTYRTAFVVITFLCKKKNAVGWIQLFYGAVYHQDEADWGVRAGQKGFSWMEVIVITTKFVWLEVLYKLLLCRTKRTQRRLVRIKNFHAHRKRYFTYLISVWRKVMKNKTCIQMHPQPMSNSCCFFPPSITFCINKAICFPGVC